MERALDLQVDDMEGGIGAAHSHGGRRGGSTSSVREARAGSSEVSTASEDESQRTERTVTLPPRQSSVYRRTAPWVVPLSPVLYRKSSETPENVRYRGLGFRLFRDWPYVLSALGLHLSLMWRGMYIATPDLMTQPWIAVRGIRAILDITGTNILPPSDTVAVYHGPLLQRSRHALFTNFSRILHLMRRAVCHSLPILVVTNDILRAADILMTFALLLPLTEAYGRVYTVRTAAEAIHTYAQTRHWLFIPNVPCQH